MFSTPPIYPTALLHVFNPCFSYSNAHRQLKILLLHFRTCALWQRGRSEGPAGAKEVEDGLDIRCFYAPSQSLRCQLALATITQQHQVHDLDIGYEYRVRRWSEVDWITLWARGRRPRGFRRCMSNVNEAIGLDCSLTMISSERR